MDDTTRRRFLRRSALGVAALSAGCAGGDGTPTATGEAGETTPTAARTERESPTPTPTDGESTPPPEETADPAPRPTPRQEGVEWLFDVGAEIDAPPAVADGTVYVGGWRETYGTPTPGGDDGPDPSNTLRALSLADGSERWRAALGGPVQRAPRAVGDAVYAVRGYNGLHGHGYEAVALSTDGVERGRYESPRLKFLSALGADGSGVYVGTHDDNLGGGNEEVAALGPGGDVRWRTPSGDIDAGTVADDGVYATDFAGTLWALDRASGAVRWTVERERPPLEGPVGLGEAVVVGDEALLAYDRASGDRVWTRPGVAPRTLLAGENRVFTVTGDGRVAAFDGADGAEAWTDEADGDDHPALAVGEDVYLAVGSRLSARDPATGTERWAVDLGGPARVVPAGDTVYAVQQGRVVALDASGERRGAVSTVGAPVGLVPADGTAVLATDEGTVYGLSV